MVEVFWNKANETYGIVREEVETPAIINIVQRLFDQGLTPEEALTVLSEVTRHEL